MTKRILVHPRANDTAKWPTTYVDTDSPNERLASVEWVGSYSEALARQDELGCSETYFHAEAAKQMQAADAWLTEE